MDLFDKEEVTAPSMEAAIAEAVKPVAPAPAVAEAKAAPAPVADATDYWANAWANRGV
jgi:hypothetical protein